MTIPRTRKKIQSFSQILKAVRRAKKKGLTVVTTNGCFDLLHIGHVRSLEQAKSYGDLLIVGINSDHSVRAIKGPDRPLVPARERAELIASLTAADHVFIFNTATPIPWLSKIKPHIHVKGADRKPNQIIERTTVEKHGGVIRQTPSIRSTTALIEKIISRAKANGRKKV